MRGHVFLSYSHSRDGGYVDRLAQYLAAAGVLVWYDRELITGQRWERVIREKIDTCAAFVVVMTPEAEESDWVTREVNHADYRDKPILPLLLRGHPFLRLNNLQHEDVTGARMPGMAFVARLRHLAAPPPPEPAAPAQQIASPAASAPPVSAATRTTPVTSVGRPSVPLFPRVRLTRRGLLVAGGSLALAGAGGGGLWRLVSMNTDHPSQTGPNNGAPASPTGSSSTGPSPGEQLCTLTGHTSTVFSVAWSPDGTQLATASTDETARIWRADTGAHLHTLTGHTSSVESVAWSPDGTQLATASYDETVRVWRADTGAHLRTLTGHTNWVGSVAWSPDGTGLATASADETARVWRADTGAHLHTLTGHTNNVISVAWSPNGTQLATASYDDTVRVWRADTGAHLRTLGYTSTVYSVAWSPDGTQLATASGDKTARVWQA